MIEKALICCYEDFGLIWEQKCAWSVLGPLHFTFKYPTFPQVGLQSAMVFLSAI